MWYDEPDKGRYMDRTMSPEYDNPRERARSIPIVGGDAPLVSRRKAQGIIHDLSTIDPSIVERVHGQIDLVVGELHAELDRGETGEGYHLSEDELRGVVARSVLRGAAQIASDLGGTIGQIRDMETILAVSRSPEEETNN
jgi:hypothetical protein